jgi:hypothetical protein
VPTLVAYHREPQVTHLKFKFPVPNTKGLAGWLQVTLHVDLVTHAVFADNISVSNNINQKQYFYFEIVEMCRTAIESACMPILIEPLKHFLQTSTAVHHSNPDIINQAVTKQLISLYDITATDVFSRLLHVDELYISEDDDLIDFVSYSDRDEDIDRPIYSLLDVITDPIHPSLPRQWAYLRFVQILLLAAIEKPHVTVTMLNNRLVYINDGLNRFFNESEDSYGVM